MENSRLNTQITWVKTLYGKKCILAIVLYCLWGILFYNTISKGVSQCNQEVHKIKWCLRKKMPKYFRSMVLKYQFLERGGDMGKIAPKYFSEHICRVFGITPPGKTHTIFEKFLHLLRFLEKLLMAASVPKNRCSEYSKYFPWQIWGKVFKSGPSKICGRHPLKNLKGYGLLK